ncbi:MAG: DUF721 domain-containing protein [Hyphomicrobiales bacterium]|nr:DUF721 domain-containing protein [Hyphomicrobiales bacterium]
MTTRRNTGKTKQKTHAGKTAPVWTPKHRKAQAVGEFVPKVMRPAFEKFGFPAAAILTEWSAIAGTEIAAFTAPEKLKWPRKEHGEDDTGQQRGATLILRVSGARALEVDHMRPRIIERINASFGYRAVSEIRLIQAPIAEKPSAKQPKIDESASNDPLLADIPDSPLKDALARIAGGVRLQARAKGGKAVQQAFTGNS